MSLVGSPATSTRSARMPGRISPRWDPFEFVWTDRAAGSAGVVGNWGDNIFAGENSTNWPDPYPIMQRIQDVLSGNWGRVLGIDLSNCNPICDAANGVAANSWGSSVPKPPDPILRYDRCATQVRNLAEKNFDRIELISAASLGNAVLGCAGTGPLVVQCEAWMGAVEMLVTGVNWGAKKNSIWEGEAACLQRSVGR